MGVGIRAVNIAEIAESEYRKYSRLLWTSIRLSFTMWVTHRHTLDVWLPHLAGGLNLRANYEFFPVAWGVAGSLEGEEIDPGAASEW